MLSQSGGARQTRLKGPWQAPRSVQFLAPLRTCELSPSHRLPDHLRPVSSPQVIFAPAAVCLCSVLTLFPFLCCSFSLICGRRVRLANGTVCGIRCYHPCKLTIPPLLPLSCPTCCF